MKIVIFEADPFVRLDLEETVALARPEAVVTAFQTEGADLPADADLIITDARDAVAGHVPMILTDAFDLTGTRDGTGRYLIHRPFTSDEVIAAIRTMLGK